MSNREAPAASERPLPPLPKSKALRRQARRDGGYDMVPAYTAEEVIAIVLADRAASAPLTDEQIDRAADEWSYAILLGKGSVAAREAFRAASGDVTEKQAAESWGYAKDTPEYVAFFRGIYYADQHPCAASVPQAVRMPLTDEEIDAAARRTMTGSNASGLALSAFKAGARWAECHTPKEGKNP
jgi:hypothetical protein